MSDGARPDMGIFRMIASATVVLLACIVAVISAQAGDSHAEYYYPEPQSRETYASPVKPLATVNKRSRIGFTVGLNEQQLKRSYAPQYHIFAKGKYSQKMIIVASGSGRYDTLYRMRALLAALSAEARISPLFQQSRKPENLNFLDLARMVGFTQVTLSDGNNFAHRIDLR